MLKRYTYDKGYVAGCDEAGRGCLAGPVVAAAVILPEGFKSESLDDSKKLSKDKRTQLRKQIETEALAWQVSFLDPAEIDKLNILWASIEGMHRALKWLTPQPAFILVDGNKFKPYGEVPFETVVKGDGKYLCIAAASILAKTHRDEYMEKLHQDYPYYHWDKNKGYPTAQHRDGIRAKGPCEHHRKSFRLLEEQLSLF